MKSRTISKSSVLKLDRAQQEILRGAIAVLEQARVQAGPQIAHRSARRLHVSYRSLAEAALIAGVFTLALWSLRPVLMGFWQDCILWWAARLDIPLTLSDRLTHAQWVLLIGEDSLVPGPLVGVLTAAGVIAIFASTYWMPDRLTPVKYLLRTLCALQASALVFFMFYPSRFPYSVGGHLNSMLEGGYYLMLAIPLLMALGYGVLRVPLHHKLLATPAILLYFTVLVPHKALLHVIALQHLSVLFMPLLYLCFGLLFDLMVFVALYSWWVSRVPADAVR